MRTVIRVIDGETVGLDDGSELRLIGALAPRALDVGLGAGAWPAEAKSRDALSEFLLSKSIELKFDVARLDRYGRLQAPAFLIEGEQRRWVQQDLLSRGLARAYALPGNTACIGELMSAEGSAREAGLGLWADAAYQVRSASNPGELMEYRTTFQLVEGQVVRVALARGSIYLNFDRNWREAFSVSLRRGDRQLLGSFADNPKALEGRRVRARGWIEVRDGPRIDLSAGGAIEVVPDPPAATGVVSPR
jgi:micrococcal nuclease